ncbi:serine-threonine/tyrosine-protein kinase catalytic domain-containing protein [Tanacetum coccineum]
MSIMKDWEHLKILFKKIDVATEKFKTCIGRGGYGRVYKGVLSIDGKDTTIAVKRLNEQFGQGLKEFLTEIQLLSGQEHPNLISLLGYCDKGKEKIIVYEYVARGSLDRYIRRRNRDESSTTLTWLETLKISVDAARGLDHLHNYIGGHRTIIHRDIKSSNILIDENWVAKISDLGLSKLSVMGFGMSLIVSNGCGTPGYCEPEYYTSGVVTKKSDVYSFGIVLFEVLCGRLCIIEPENGFILSGKSVKEYYNMGNLVEITDPKKRPAMDIVAKELEETLYVHVEHELEENDVEYWEKKLPDEYQRYIEMSDIPLKYTNKKELYLLFSHGFLANNGQLKLKTLSLPESRFKEVKKLETDGFYEFKCRLESFMFSPGNYDYACYLVFKLEDGHILSNDRPIFRAEYLEGCDVYLLKKPEEESGSFNSWVEKRDDGWLEARLTNPLSLKHHLENLTELKVLLIVYERLNGIVEGVEFRPVVVDNGCIISSSVPKKVQDFVAGLHDVHKAVHENLVRANSKYKQDEDHKRRHVDFEVGDFVWAVLTKDRFPVAEYNKLSAKKIGPLEIVEKMNSNAYRLMLPSHIPCSDVFNVKHLLPYHGDSSDEDSVENSRANFVYPEENDVNPSIEERDDFCEVKGEDAVRAICDIAKVLLAILLQDLSSLF